MPFEPVVIFSVVADNPYAAGGRLPRAARALECSFLPADQPGSLLSYTPKRMIFLISTFEPLRIDWMPQWIAHYRALGVERFLLTLRTDPELTDDERTQAHERFVAMLAAQGIDNPYFQVEAFTAAALRDRHDELQREHVAATDWVVWCDSDEYQLYPLPLPELAAWAGKHGVNLFRGVMIDRIGVDGGLPPWDPDRPVWEQFPVACFLPTRLGGGERQKITFARGNVTLSNGNHYVNAGMPAQTIGKWVQVHHFKWDATVKERLGLRVLPEYRIKAKNWIESQRALDYFDAHGGRFDLDDVKPLDLPARDFIDWVGGGHQLEVPAPPTVDANEDFSLAQTLVNQPQRKPRF